ncbi:MAG: hypothetical protein Q7T16_03350 [Candidatus Burarchaeum sp.]|nr:hypothetical protein [Candidatus Burarchaeum sp.]MDO8339668.1 hypothetical protein [Candidatus Burarchaeum sp.]
MKAQSATEFLLNYSWAILALTALIVVLLLIGLPNLANSEPERCDFPAGSTGCEILRLDNGGSGDALQVKDFILTNNFNKKIYICGIGCSQSFSSTPPLACGGSLTKPPIAPGANVKLDDVPVLFGASSARCTDDSGQPVILAVNGIYRGNLYLFYSYDGETTGNAHVSTGAIVARAGQA